MISRRNLLALAASSPFLRGAKKYPIGLELYSVRNELARDLPNTLKTVSQMGYEVVEFYAPYFNWSLPHAKDVRALMDDLGIGCHSTHNGLQTFRPLVTERPVLARTDP